MKPPSSARLPMPVRRLIELWEHYRHFRKAKPVDADEALTLRIAYGNLHTAFGKSLSRTQLQQLARQSRQALRQTECEIANGPLWCGFVFEGLSYLRLALSRGRGALVVSCHVGSYRFIPAEIAHLGYSVDVVVDQRGVQRENSVQDRHLELRQQCMDAQGRAGYWRAEFLDRIGIINAEAPDIAMRIVRALREGHVVMVYVDGNTGSGPKKAEHLVRVPFLGTHLLVRQGIGELAKLTGAPVVPVFAGRRALRRHVCRFHAPIEPRPEEPRDAFSKRVLTETMALFERRLEGRPAHWEEWHHLHRMQEPSDASAVQPSPNGALDGRCAVDSFRAFAVSQGGDHFVYEPERQRFVRVSKLGLELLRALYQPRSLPQLTDHFAPTYGQEAVVEELKRLATRGWLERSA